jgi:hypothetical protein
VGPYHVIKNISYASKKASITIDKTQEVKTIQLPFDPDKFNFTQMPYCELISFVDLDKGTLIFGEESKDDSLLQLNEYQTQHIIKISKSHIAHGHAIFVPYVRENLPQVLTPRLI